jgi:hypothetical protein
MKKIKTFETFNTNKKFNELDSVVLKNDIGSEVVKIGMVGTIVYTYDDDIYEVEFFDSEKNTIGVETVSIDDLEFINN